MRPCFAAFLVLGACCFINGWGMLVVPALARAAGQEAGVAVRPLEGWSTAFGSGRPGFTFLVTAQKSFAGLAGWSLTVADRVIARGEMAVAVEPGKPARVRPDLRLPPVKAGVTVSVVLTVSVFRAGQRVADASAAKTIWVFSDDPFTDRTKWLKGLRIRLFDPERKTARTFEKARVPFRRLRNIDAFADVGRALLVIGERVSFRDYRALPEAMVKAAAGGAQVLCLAPSAGEMMLPGADPAAPPTPQSVSLRRSDVITELDKRLDAAAWPKDGRVARTSIVLNAERRGVVARITPGDRGWQWLDVRFPGRADRGGRLIICTFALIEKWDSGPTPRFLLARLFEILDPTAGGARPPAQRGERR